MVDCFAAAAALPEDLVVFERSDGVLGYGAPFPEPAVVSVFDDAAVWSAARCSRLVAAAVAAVAGGPRVVGEAPAGGVPVYDHIVPIPWPCVADGDDAPVPWPADDLDVHAAPVILAFSCAGLIVDGDERARPLSVDACSFGLARRSCQVPDRLSSLP